MEILAATVFSRHCMTFSCSLLLSLYGVAGLWQSFFAPCGRGRKRDWGTPPGPRKGAAAPWNPAFSRSCDSPGEVEIVVTGYLVFYVFGHEACSLDISRSLIICGYPAGLPLAPARLPGHACTQSQNQPRIPYVRYYGSNGNCQRFLSSQGRVYPV